MAGQFDPAVILQRCPDTALCISMSQFFRDIMLEYFYNFVDTNYLLCQYNHRVGTPSANGAVIKQVFGIDGVVAFVALKTTAPRHKVDSDSLAYEYTAGATFVNGASQAFPCFQQTYNLLMAANDGVVASLVANQGRDPRDWLGIGVVATTAPYGRDLGVPALPARLYCGPGYRLMLQVEYFPNFASLHRLVYSTEPESLSEIVTSLYQVYFVLVALRNRFMHGDMHTENIGLYRPFFGEKKYILFQYHVGTAVVQFKSSCVTKLIDYGRVWCPSTPDILSRVCNSGQCTPTRVEPNFYCGSGCGCTFGYGFLRLEYDPSEDLRPIAETHYDGTPNILYTVLNTLGVVGRVSYHTFWDDGAGLRQRQLAKEIDQAGSMVSRQTIPPEFGSARAIPPRSARAFTRTAGLSAASRSPAPNIFTVEDALHALENFLPKLDSLFNYDADGWTHGATLDVFADGVTPFVWTAAP
jgi:hypothetical protein